jgi:hypothetical protein
VLFALLLCLASAAFYNAGVVLQSSGAYGSDADRLLRVSLFATLARVPAWLFGTLVGVAGWALQVWALTRASLTFVQPALGTGVFFLLGFAWLVLHTRPQPRDGAAALALAAGVGLLSHFAPAAMHGTGRTGEWIVAVAVLAGAALAPLALRARKRVLGPMWLAASVGFAYALTGLSSEVTSRGIESKRPEILVAGVVVTALFGAVGFLSETSALVSGAVTAVVPVIVLVDTVIPVALAPALFDERWPHTPGRLLALVAGLALATGGAAALAASPGASVTRSAADQTATPAARTDP